MIREKAGERAWAMHCAGRDVGEIARRLHVDRDFAREQIVARWRREREDYNRMVNGGGR